MNVRMSELARLVVILGPTASGKSALGISLAERLGGEILVCDSTQVYRHFDIGTGKVPSAEQRGIPHHLVDLVDPDEVFTAGEYRRRALEVLADVRRRNKLPIITAGTGLYLRALLEGLADAPERSEELRERLRKKAQKHGPLYLHRVLARLDREAGARIAPRDTQKIIRAIEIRKLAAKPVGEVHRGGRSALAGFEIRKIGLRPPRDALYARINARVESMIAAGWPDEVRAVIARGVPADAKPFQFIGYSDLYTRLVRRRASGSRAIAEAIPLIQQATRRFSKRQITWFRKEPEVHWLPGFGDDPQVLAPALAIAT
jgi:tRNA dimethylallyltransferase